MAKVSTPIWLSDDDIEEIPFQQNQTSNSSSGQPTQSNYTENDKKTFYQKLFYWFFRVVAIMLSLLMAITSAIGLSMINGVDKSGKIFVGVYMFFFATLLFLFEINQIKTIEKIDHMFKRNFGFLFSAAGNAFFIIFIAFLSFGLGDPQVLSFVTGACLAAFGICKLCIYLQYPEFLEYK